MSLERAEFFAPVEWAIKEFVPVAITSPSARIPHTKNVATVIEASSRLPILPTQNASTIVKSDLTTVCSTAGIASDNINFLSDTILVMNLNLILIYLT